MEQLDQLQKEWILINASRELLSITKKRIVSYKDSIEFSKENAEELFKDSQTSLSKKDVLDKLYDKYKQEAKARSIETGEEVLPKMLIESRLSELETYFTPILPKLFNTQQHCRTTCAFLSPSAPASKLAPLPEIKKPPPKVVAMLPGVGGSEGIASATLSSVSAIP